MPVTRSTGKGRIIMPDAQQSSSSGTTATSQSVWTETTAHTAMSAETGTTTTTEASTSAADASAATQRSATTEATGTTARLLERPGTTTEAVRRSVPPTARQDGAPTEAIAPPTARQGGAPTEQNRRKACLTAADKPPVSRARSKHAGSVQTKTQKIAKAKEELARLQVELAAARLAALETEETDNEDDVSEYSELEAEARVGSWLESQEPEPNPATEEQKPHPVPAGACPQDFSQLASAITLAVKAARQPRFVELPVFNGSHQDWLSFRAAYFETANSFTKVENMNRLRRNLKGRAKEAVEGLLITNADPSDVMKTLESRFGRPEAIAMTEIDALKTLPRLTESPRDICIFSSKVTNAVSTLRALNCIHYLYNPEAAKVMVEKLTPTLRYRYYDFAAVQQKEDPDLLKFEKFLKKEAELCGPYAQPEQVGTHSHPTQQNRRAQNVHTVTEKQSTGKCPICDDTGHTAMDCEKFKKADENSRWDIAKSKRLCFRCLRYRNKTHSCRPKTCGINDCKYFHNRMLHFVRKTEKTENSNEKGSTEAINSAWTGTQRQSYLKIIPVQVKGPTAAVDTYALLDDGSTVTLIDDSICKKIGATGPIDPLRIEAINKMKTAETQSRRVNLVLEGVNSHEEPIQARTVKNLQVATQEIPREQIEECKHLRDISDILTYEDATKSHGGRDVQDDVTNST